MRKLLVLALLALGCGGDSMPKAGPAQVAPAGSKAFTRIIGSDTVWAWANIGIDSVKPSVRLKTDTLVKTDTLIKTVTVTKTDSLYFVNGQWVKTKPPLPAIVTAVRLGAFAFPSDSFGTGGWPYNGTSLPVGPNVLTDLAKIQAAKGQVILMLPRIQSLVPTGSDPKVGLISVAKATDFVNRMFPDSAAAAPYLRDGTILGVMVSDDIMGDAIWGPGAPYMAQIDSMAGAVKKRMGSKVIPYVRGNSEQLAGPDGTTNVPYTFRWLKGSWNQYSHLVNDKRFGTIAQYFARMEAAAAKIKTTDGRPFCQIYGLNMINGGDGSSGKPSGEKTLTGVPYYWMSGQEIIDAYTAFMPYTTMAIHWSWNPDFAKGLNSDPDVKAALIKMRALADKTPAKTCTP